MCGSCNDLEAAKYPIRGSIETMSILLDTGLLCKHRFIDKQKTFCDYIDVSFSTP